MTLDVFKNQAGDVLDELVRMGMSPESAGFFVEHALAGGVLSDEEIFRRVEEKRLFISPFRRENVANSSVDVCLGRWFVREQHDRRSARKIYNPYDPSHVRKIWGEPDSIETAITARQWQEENGEELANIHPDEEIIVIGPGETILAHTMEFIGGADGFITTMMKARSSMGRNFIGVCKCAGWGDIGYHNRWTMEVTNFSQNYAIPLVVGRRIAQIVFFRTGGTTRPYFANGKYMQQPLMEMSYDELERTWLPEAMLPRMYNDREAKQQIVVARG